MPQQPNVVAMNAFNKGLKTEYTGLNFPEDAATSASNCIFNRIGNTTRRPGINYETNFAQSTINRTSLAINTYRWNNVGGSGSTRVLVTQVGTNLLFYKVNTATVASPLSTQLLASGIDIANFISSGGSLDTSVECQFTDGNGYLFVFHPSCDPFYIVYTFGAPDTVAGTRITVQNRDFQGIPDTLEDNARPSTLSTEHQYNLQNQGWTSGTPWTANVTGNATTLGTGAGKVFAISGQSSVLAAAVGKVVQIYAGKASNPPTIATGIVTAYVSPNSITLNITSFSSSTFGSTVTPTILISSGYTVSANLINTGFVTQWFGSLGNYPSNADQWWQFKNASDAFDPTTAPNVTLNSGPAPKGFYILNSFDQQRDNLSGVAITDITTTVRPRTGCWFQGRVWYAGTDAQQNANGDVPNYTWTENIYFSQIIEREDQFGKCYQRNDPTSEDLFALLPTDGGTFKIQGCGSVYKLFPFQNGLLVFAANGVWFITGSQGIGFAANDYTIVPISTVQSISSTSLVNVQGTPMWWNEEAIYTVSMSAEQGGASYGPTRGALGNSNISVQPVTYASIQTFYDAIPLQSKKYVRGDYDSINWEIRWIYRTTNETTTTDRYQFDGLLTYNTITQAFSPWTTSTTSGVPYVHAVNYIQGPGGSTSPDPILKYLCSIAVAGPTYLFTFAEENDETNWSDWHSTGIDYDYTSTFTLGYMVHGKGIVKFQDRYLNIWVNNITNWSYRLQGIWDYAINGNSGKYTPLEQVSQSESVSNFAVVNRRTRITGRGYALQYKFTSVTGKPFDIIGWSINEGINQSV